MTETAGYRNLWIWGGCGCVGIVIALVVSGTLFFLAGSGGAPLSFEFGVQDEALDLVRRDLAVVEQLGEPIELGWSLNGVQTHGDEGRADYSIPVTGPYGDGRIYVKAFSTDDEWTFEELFVRIDGVRYNIVGDESSNPAADPVDNP